MKLLFSEYKSDYSRYHYSYVIWGFPEAGETPAAFFRRGFMPGSPTLDRFYVCRQLRVDLGRFTLSSENRRILRKTEGTRIELIPRAAFDFSPARRAAWRAFAEERFGEGVMGEQRLNNLLAGKVITHVLHVTEAASGRELGDALLYVEEPELAFYYYAFYDLEWFRRNLGLFMMTSAARLFQERGFKHLHLGTCYSRRALYKTQFQAVQFFNGFRWSDDLEELKFLIRREENPIQQHLLETEAYRAGFCGGDVAGLAATAGWALLEGGGPGDEAT
jgi:arginyl-tRNA--protein-N-Asp/Glu arginylyltransferase